MQRAAPSPAIQQRMNPSRIAPVRAAEPRRDNRRETQRNVPNRRQLSTPAQNRVTNRAANRIAEPARRAAPTNRAERLRDQRRERVVRQREDRQLRSLPPRQRAARRDQIQQQRQQRVQRRDQQQSPAARQGIAATPDARSPARTTTRARTVTPQAALQGRFGAAFRARGGRDPAARAERLSARQAWRHGRRASFVAWAGPVFWPYAYSDIFDYTFFPAAYDEGFWAYAYDDFFDSVFWPDGGPYAGYASAGPYDGNVTAALPGRRSSPSTQAQQRLAKQLCSDPAKGITAWPFERINEVVRPTAEQRALLDELKRAAASAAETFKRTCTDEVSLTPPGRLRAMLDRLTSTREALGMVRPPLEKFYESLTDEQKARFNAIGPAFARNAKTAPDDAQNLTAGCGQPKPGLTNLPIDRIDDVVRPAGSQKDALDALSADTKKAVEILAAACPDEIPQTPVGRLEAMEKRLDAMIAAAKIVQPSLGKFYTSLSAEQKARFNRMAGDEERAAN
jgi:flagellar biosynthesis GTPase FlhF